MKECHSNALDSRIMTLCGGRDPQLGCQRLTPVRNGTPAPTFLASLLSTSAVQKTLKPHSRHPIHLSSLSSAMTPSSSTNNIVRPLSPTPQRARPPVCHPITVSCCTLLRPIPIANALSVCKLPRIRYLWPLQLRQWRGQRLGLGFPELPLSERIQCRCGRHGRS